MSRQRDRMRSNLHTAHHSRRVRNLLRVTSLHPPPALRAKPVVDLEIRGRRLDRRQIRLVLVCHATQTNGTGTMRADQQRRNHDRSVNSLRNRTPRTWSARLSSRLLRVRLSNTSREWRSLPLPCSPLLIESFAECC